MRAERKGRNFIVYEKEETDYQQEAMLRMAALQAQSLPDAAACRMAALFPAWQPGVSYAAGARITDGQGNLYRVEQAHTSQMGWLLEDTPALYTPLGVTAEDPEAIPEWRQPSGAHDAYSAGDRVRYGGTVYISLMDGNVWAPDAFPAGWAAE